MRGDFERLVSLFHKTGSVNGRKKIQKMVFLLQNAGLDFGKTFRYHYYGPYCTELQLEMDALVDMGVLEERHNGYSYSYRIAKETDLNTKWEACERNSALIEYLNRLSPQVLELASTLVFLSERDYGDFDSVKKKALSLKPELEAKMLEAEAVHERVTEERLKLGAKS